MLNEEIETMDVLVIRYFKRIDEAIQEAKELAQGKMKLAPVLCLCFTVEISDLFT